MNLLDLKDGESALILKVKGRGGFRKRIMEMGFVAGKVVKAIKSAPLGDPSEYFIMNYNVSLRNSEALLIEITKETSTTGNHTGFSEGIATDEAYSQKNAKPGEKTINVALVGNPNSGKTTIFNYASGMQERVGNYSGVTIEAKEGSYKYKGYNFKLVDLPGTYSLSAYTPEEIYVRENIFSEMPDVVVNVIDSTNLERNLYLTTQLIDMDIRVVVALNMYDEFSTTGDKLDNDALGRMLGIPFIPTVGSKNKGITELFDKIIDVFEDREETVRHIHINYGIQLEKSVRRIQDTIYAQDDLKLTNIISSRFAAIKLLEKDSNIKEILSTIEKSDDIFSLAQAEIKTLETDQKEDTETLITDARYGFIAGALKENLKPNSREKVKKSDLIDTIITHKFWGIPIFGLFMWLMFFTTFNLGSYPKSWLEALIQWLSDTITLYLPPSVVRDFLTQGIIGGIGGVIVFLPNILLLFLFISLMEDTGYMSRAVFIMDKAMHKVGLHGKSFIPLIMGFGCNVPAILASRTIESRRDRLITMLINPFMSCSARLPVYILFISAFFVKYQTGVLFILYFIGVFAALFTSILLGKTVLRKNDVPFVMELPPYRMPTPRTLLKHMWFSSRMFLRKIGGVVMIASVIIWALGYFPLKVDFSRDYDKEIKSLSSGLIIQPDGKMLSNTFTPQQTAAMISTIKSERETERQEKSYIGILGKAIAPVMKPLGFDWKMTVSLMAGVAAKEVVVGTLGVLYQGDKSSGAASVSSLTTKLQQQTYTSGSMKGKKVYTPLVAFSFMLFVLIYFPCVGVIAAIRKESGKLKWALFEIFYTTGLAWLIAFTFFQIAMLIA